MKILALADLHLRENKPECRAEEEDWLKAIGDKIHFIYQTAKENKVDYIVIAGDVFDSWRNNSMPFLCQCISWFKTLNIAAPVVCIPGNHDTMGGNLNELERSPYELFARMKVFNDASIGDFDVYNYQFEGKQVGKHPVVIAHKGLYLKEKPYPTAPDKGNVEYFVRNCLSDSCKLLIAGDYHKPFVTKIDNCTVVNCGSLMRLTAAQCDYKPAVWLCDVDDSVQVTKNSVQVTKNDVQVTKNDVQVTKIDVPLNYPVSRKHIDSVNARQEYLEDIIGSVEGDFEITLSFKYNFRNIVKDLDNSKEILNLFEECNK